MEKDQKTTVDELNRLNQARQIAVGIALVLLVISLLAPSVALAVLRSFAWAAAGLLSLMHTSKARQAGFNASYLNAIIYFVVAVIPLVKRW